MSDIVEEMVGRALSRRQASPIEGLTLVRLEHGKVAEEWTFANSLEMLVQIGALPADVLGGT